MAEPWWQSGRFIGPVVAALLGVATVAALLIDVTEPAPWYALESTMVLRAERAVLLFGLLLLPFVAVYRAFTGQLPVEFTMFGTRWRDLGEATEASKNALDELRKDLDAQAKLLTDEIGPRVQDLEKDVDALWERVA